jgi:hypothetical protein
MDMTDLPPLEPTYDDRPQYMEPDREPETEDGRPDQNAGAV